MNPIERLDKLLTDAGIPHELNIEMWHKDRSREADDLGIRCEADKYMINQIVYGRASGEYWKLDAIWQRGSYGRFGNMLECYGTMIGREPKAYAVDDVFRMIEADWKKKQ